MLIGFQILPNDVDAVCSKDVVNLGKNAGYVVVNVNETMCVFQGWQGEVGEVYTIAGAACVDVVHNFARHKVANVLLRFKCASSNVWCKNSIGQSTQF